MTSLVQKMIQKEEDEDNLEALRLAALETLAKKQSPPPAKVVFQPHMANPNLIAIIPAGAAQPNHHNMPAIRSNFVWPQPRMQPFRTANNKNMIGSTLKVLSHGDIKINNVARIDVKEEVTNKKEEVTTKFSRFEDTESESEEESDNEEKETESSEDENDVLNLENNDDSLEALMEQMEHEIGIDCDPSKKKKCKGSKVVKDKDTKTQPISKEMLVTEKAKTENIVKENVEQIIVTSGKNNIVTNLSPTLERCKSNEKSQSLITNCERKPEELPLKCKSPPVKDSKLPLKLETKTPLNNNTHAPITQLQTTRNEMSSVKNIRSSPTRKVNCVPPITQSSVKENETAMRIVTKLPSSPKMKSVSPARSPISKSHHPARSPRRSPLPRSPDRYYRDKRSPSPYYRTQTRCYMSRNRSPSPIRKRSITPRRSPKYYRKRSQSPWSPDYRQSAPSITLKARYRSRSPIPRRSISPRHNSKSSPTYIPVSPSFWSPHRRRSRSASPARPKSPMRKKEYSPRRHQYPLKRDYNYRKNSASPKRKSPLYRKYTPPTSPRHKRRSSTPRKCSPRRRTPPPVCTKESQPKTNYNHSRSQSLSLSPSPSRDSKEPPRRYMSPLKPRKELNGNVTASNIPSKNKRSLSPDLRKEVKNKKTKLSSDSRDKSRKKLEEKKAEKAEKKALKGSKREKDNNNVDKLNVSEPMNVTVIENPVFEARRKKFENASVVEPASKKIRLSTKKTNTPVVEKELEKKKTPEVKQVVENSKKTLDDEKNVPEEIDEIDSFLNEDVLDLSGAFWSSDDDLLPTINTKKEKSFKKVKQSIKTTAEKERISSKEKEIPKKRIAVVSPRPTEKKPVKKNRHVSPPADNLQRSPEQVQTEAVKKQKGEEGDLRAELSRRRKERLTKAGSLDGKLPARLLQSAFESALGKKKSKKEEKVPKSEKESKKNKPSTSTTPKEKTDGRRVLVLKRPTAIRMQSAHINVTFPKESSSESKSSYSTSSSDEQYASPIGKLPLYMRLGSIAKNKGPGKRKVKVRSRRSQV